MTDASVHPDELDPEYHHHGGFPEYGPASPGAGFGQFVATMRRLQDLAVAADPGDAVWDEAAVVGTGGAGSGSALAVAGTATVTRLALAIAAIASAANRPLRRVKLGST